MTQKIKDRDGYIILHFKLPSSNLVEIKFVVVVAHQQRQILFCRYREDGCWGLPGGRVKPGETIEETAYREVLEETGATLKRIQILCYMHCFMYGLEYWGITYLGDIDQLRTPADLNEVIEAALFADLPNDLSARSCNQIRALYSAALNYLPS